ncbi:MAG: hypothetical protein M3178_18435 [Pseudomonadota bacterium]|nr:hypothetical protein [Pseudomonadota bacterium]
MRPILTAVFVAALIAVPAQSKAAPRSIDDCEKIQAADAYNQCLALFGPVARGHGGSRAGADVDGQDAEATPGHAKALVAAAGDWGRDHGARHASKHGWTRHSWARHGRWHRTRTATHRHGKTTTVAFSVVPAHTRLR